LKDVGNVKTDPQQSARIWTGSSWLRKVTRDGFSGKLYAVTGSFLRRSLFHGASKEGTAIEGTTKEASGSGAKLSVTSL
jgi:hypothetical protein